MYFFHVINNIDYSCGKIGLEAESDVEFVRSTLELRLILTKYLRVEMLVVGCVGAILVAKTHHFPVDVDAERIERSKPPQCLSCTCHFLAVRSLTCVFVTVQIFIARKGKKHRIRCANTRSP